MKVKIKKLHKDAVIPSYAKNGDAGMDLTCISSKWDNENRVWIYSTGLSFEIPIGYVGLLFPRSSIYKQDLSLSNSVGVLDSGYRGEILFKFKETMSFNEEHEYTPREFRYQEFDRIGQIIILPYPQIEFEEVDELSETERGAGGYGSTGN